MRSIYYHFFTGLLSLNGVSFMVHLLLKNLCFALHGKWQKFNERPAMNEHPYTIKVQHFKKRPDEIIE